MSEQYLHSLLCSLILFYGDIFMSPCNHAEIVFSAAMLLVSFVLTSAFVSNFTMRMTRMQILLSDETQKRSTLKRFLAFNDISPDLRSRVQRNACFAWQQHQKNVKEADVELLGFVSE